MQKRRSTVQRDACRKLVSVLGILGLFFLGCGGEDSNEQRGEQPGVVPQETPSPSPTPGPDLTIELYRENNGARVTQEFISENSCSYLERCVPEPGFRRLLRFDTLIVNRGEADLVVGPPGESELAVFDSCHGHYHLNGVMEYELFGPAQNSDQSPEDLVRNAPAAVGRKQSFCLEDRVNWLSQGPSQYTCEFQGISAGWADLYDASLDCQWIDITNLPNGNYTLRLRVNGSRIYPDTRSDNNSLLVPLKIEDPDQNMDPDVSLPFGREFPVGPWSLRSQS